MSTALTPTTQFFNELSARKTALINFLGDEKNALRFTSSVMQCIQQNPKLLECKKESLIGAFLECAAVNLFPSNWSGECFVIPYNSKNGMVAQFQMGYRGFLTLAYRAGVGSIWSEIVYDGDEFLEEKGTEPRLVHVPTKPENRGKPIAVYACAKKGENTWFKVMWEPDIMSIKKLSKAAASSSSPWNSNTDPELWMWKKTCIKQLLKFVPRSGNDDLSRATHSDNVSERGGYFADENKLVEGEFVKNDLPEVETYISKLEELKTQQEIEDFRSVFSRVAHEYPKEDRELVMQAIIDKTKSISDNAPDRTQDKEKEALEIELKDLQDSLKDMDPSDTKSSYTATLQRIEEIKKHLENS